LGAERPLKKKEFILHSLHLGGAEVGHLL